MTSLQKEYAYFSEFGNSDLEKLESAINQEDDNSPCDCGCEPHKDHCQLMIETRLEMISELIKKKNDCPTITLEV